MLSVVPVNEGDLLTSVSHCGLDSVLRGADLPLPARRKNPKNSQPVSVYAELSVLQFS